MPVSTPFACAIKGVDGDPEPVPGLDPGGHHDDGETTLLRPPPYPDPDMHGADTHGAWPGYSKPQWLLLGSGVVGCLTRPSLRRGRRAGLCRDGGRYARSERNRDTTVVCLARCRGAGAARSAAATRSPRWC